MSKGFDRNQFFALSAQFRQVPNTGYFLGHFTSRVGYTRGATLTDPLSLARHLHISDEDFPAIAAFLDEQDLVAINSDASMTLTRRGEEWYGDHALFRQEMLRDIDAQWWHDLIAGVRDMRGYDEQSHALNEHHGSILLEFARRMATEAVRDHAPEKVRLGLVATAMAIAVANDGTRPAWIPSFADSHEAIVSLIDAATRIGLDAPREVRGIADIVTGQARVMLRDYTVT